MLRSDAVIPTLFGLPSPRLPTRNPGGAWTSLTLAGALHLMALAVTVIMLQRTAQPRTGDQSVASNDVRVVLPPDLLFLPGTAGAGGGGGGGGNR